MLLEVFCDAEYLRPVIKGFRCRDTERLFGDQAVPRFRAIERVARRKPLLLHRRSVWMISGHRRAIDCKRSKGDRRVNPAFASTTIGGYASAGTQVMPMTSRSWATIAELSEGNVT